MKHHHTESPKWHYLVNLARYIIQLNACILAHHWLILSHLSYVGRRIYFGYHRFHYVVTSIHGGLSNLLSVGHGLTADDVVRSFVGHQSLATWAKIIPLDELIKQQQH